MSHHRSTGIECAGDLAAQSIEALRTGLAIERPVDGADKLPTKISSGPFDPALRDLAQAPTPVISKEEPVDENTPPLVNEPLSKAPVV